MDAARPVASLISGSYAQPASTSNASIAMPELMTVRRRAAFGVDGTRALASGFAGSEAIRPVTGVATTPGAAGRPLVTPTPRLAHAGSAGTPTITGGPAAPVAPAAPARRAVDRSTSPLAVPQAATSTPAPAAPAPASTPGSGSVPASAPASAPTVRRSAESTGTPSPASAAGPTTSTPTADPGPTTAGSPAAAPREVATPASSPTTVLRWARPTTDDGPPATPYAGATAAGSPRSWSAPPAPGGVPLPGLLGRSDRADGLLRRSPAASSASPWTPATPPSPAAPSTRFNPSSPSSPSAASPTTLRRTPAGQHAREHGPAAHRHSDQQGHSYVSGQALSGPLAAMAGSTSPAAGGPPVPAVGLIAPPATGVPTGGPGPAPSGRISRMTVAPPRISISPSGAGTSGASTTGSGTSSGTGSGSAPAVPAVARRTPQTSGASGSGEPPSLLESTAHLFNAAPEGVVRRLLDEGGRSMSGHQHESWSAGGSSASPGTAVRRWAEGSRNAGPVAFDGDHDDVTTGPGLEELVDAVVERVEQRVIDELERRGRRQGWVVF